MNVKLAAAFVVAIGTLAAIAPVAYAADSSAAVKAADTDGDGTVDLAEAKKAAMAKFTMMDADKEGTVDPKEAGMDVSAVDSDKDGTLDKTEYEAAVTSAFKAADPDGDGTVDAKEMASPAGAKLGAMID